MQSLQRFGFVLVAEIGLFDAVRYKFDGLVVCLFVYEDAVSVAVALARQDLRLISSNALETNFLCPKD